MNILLRKCLFIYILLSKTVYGYSQDFLNVYLDSIHYAETKIKRLPNGDIILATSSLESLRNGGKEARLFCQRINYCGQVMWSYAYKVPDDHIIMNDFAILNTNEIVLYGSIYKGLKESIFLMKINVENGLNEEMKVFNPGTVDHFTYSIDIKDNTIIIYGLLLDFNTKKNGFIAQFNTKLNFMWAKKFFPFESSGKIAIQFDYSYIAFSGNYLFNLNKEGSPFWSYEMKGDKTVKIIGGPLITADGSVFEGVADSAHFLFKINNKGEKIWETQRYKGLGKASAISILPDKSIYVTLITQSANKKNLTHIVFLNDGLVSSISNILLPQNLSSTLLNQQVDNRNINTLIGSIDPFIGKKGDINSFLFQYEVMGKNMECLDTDPLEMVSTNYTPIKFEPVSPVFTSFSFTQENIFRPDTVSWKRIHNPFCLTETEELPLVTDTTLACNETWKINLPGDEYIWWDNFQSKERIIAVPGTYKAYKLSCSDPSIHHFTLKKENCDCPFFIPNAFSPNNDGINDLLEVYSACEITDYQWKVYSRWGNLIDSGMNTAWSGNISGEIISQGSYIFIITYTLKDVDGKMIKGQKEQIINLVR